MKVWSVRRPVHTVRYAAAVAVAACGFGAAAAVTVATAGADSAYPAGITGGQTLTDGSILESPDGHYEAVLSSGILSDRIVGGRTMWKVGSAVPGAYAVLQPNGILAIFDPTGQVLWTSGVTGSGCPALDMQLDGNLAIYDTAQIWTAGTANHGMASGDLLTSGESIFPEGSKYRLTMQSNGDLVLDNDSNKAIWTSGTSSAGAYADMQSDGNLVVYSAKKKALWSTKTSGNAGATLSFASSGNLSVLSSAGKSLWSSGSTGKAGTGSAFPLTAVPASATPCPTTVGPPTTTVVQTETQTVTNTQTVLVPTTTVIKVPTPVKTVKHVDVKMAVKWYFKGNQTFLKGIYVARMPKGVELTVTYNPHLRGHRATVRHGTTGRTLRALVSYISKVVYRPGQTLNLNMTRRGYDNEWATFTFRSHKLPTVRPVISRR